MHVSSVVRPVLPRKVVVGLFSTIVSIALLPCGIALADSASTNFEPSAFTVGQSVNGIDGWKSGIPNCFPHPYDQDVVTNPGAPGFGTQSMRISNLFGCGEFDDQTYAGPVKTPAGETQPNSVYDGKFSFFDPAFQDGLYMSVSPDSYEGSRMQWVGLEDTQKGTEITFSDTPHEDGSFEDYPEGVLKYGQVHTIRWFIKVNPGVNNDEVRIFVDGQDLGQCFTTWENFYHAKPATAPPPNVDNPAPISSMQFRTSVGAPGLPMGAGYLFDNVSMTTSNGPGLVDCNLVIDKKADASTVTAGGLAGYTITVHNRGRAVARNYLLCDHVPARMTFVSANRKLRHLGRRRCLYVPRLKPGAKDSFHISLRVDDNAPQGTETNIADITPVPPPGVLPPGSLLPGGPAVFPPAADIKGKKIPAKAIKKVKSVIKVLAKRRAATAPAPPPVTG